MTVSALPAAVVPPVEWADAVYPAAERFASRCLRQGLSLFADDLAWTTEAADDFHNRFVVQEDLSDATFMQKLDGQLASAPRETVLLAADIVYVNCLPVHDMKRATKLARVEGVLSLLTDRPSIAGVVADALDTGVASFAQANTQVWLHVRYLAEFARDWVRLEPDRQEKALADPWALKTYLSGVEPFNSFQASALQHLLFPSVFGRPIQEPRWQPMVLHQEEQLPAAPRFGSARNCPGTVVELAEKPTFSLQRVPDVWQLAVPRRSELPS